MRRSVYMIVGILLAAGAFALVSPAQAASPNLAQINGSATESTSTGLAIGRIYDTRVHGDVISFSGVDSNGAQISGVSFELPQRTRQNLPAATIFAVTESSSAAAQTLQPNASAQSVGMQFDLFGGAQATVSLQGSAANFGTGAFAPNPSQGPVVFAFYNFPQPNQRIGLGEAFGLQGRDAAFAASLNAPSQVTSVTTENSLASPLISSLSAQGPFWYSAYSPATSGSTVRLSVPFQVAKVPVNVNLGEQSMSSIEPSSLATQILGPAFATSAAYKAVTGGVTVALPLLSRRATVSLDGWYETLQHNDKMPFNLAPYAQVNNDLGAAGQGPVVYSPATDMQQYTGTASVALPVTSRLTVNGSFAQQVSGGIALDTLTQTLTQHKTAFGGGLGYNFPKANSSINLFFNKNVYTDQDNQPTFTENRQNLYFSVKF